MTQLAIKSFWQKPIAIARSIDARQLGLVLPIGVMIRNPAGVGGGAVNSVNGQTGTVVLDATDVGADPAGTAATVGATKANAVHGHAITDVVGLVVALAQVEANRLAILSKADQTALNALALIVDTKADQSDVAQQIADLVGTDQQILAAIQEIGAALAEDQDLLDALEYTVANRVRFDVNNQALTSLQKANARTNIGAEEIGVAAMLIAEITAASIGAATAAQGMKADTALQATDAPATVRGTALTGLSTATATPVLPTDLLLAAIGKLQAQITAAGSGVARRMPAGFWQTATGMLANSAVTFNANVAQYAYFYVSQTITISQISFSAVATQVGTGEVKVRFYDLTNNTAISPEYVVPAAVSGLITYALPTPLTIHAGNYFFGFLSNTATTRQFLGVSTNGALAFPSADGVLSVNRSEGRLYSAGLPATATLGGSAGGNQANINFLVIA